MYLNYAALNRLSAAHYESRQLYAAAQFFFAARVNWKISTQPDAVIVKPDSFCLPNTPLPHTRFLSVTNAQWFALYLKGSRPKLSPRVHVLSLMKCIPVHFMHSQPLIAFEMAVAYDRLRTPSPSRTLLRACYDFRTGLRNKPTAYHMDVSL